MSINLFYSEGLVALARYIGPETLFAFDLDGTLLPIVPDYAAVRMDPPVRETLERLVTLAKVSVITGRSRKDALAILGFEPQLVIGNHGAEWPGQKRRNWDFIARCLKWRERVHDILYYVEGIEMEFKGESLSLHYRKAEDPDQALALINSAIGRLTPPPRVIGGKYVVNLIPKEAFTKGQALVAAMDKFGATRAIYFGDDVTDEEVFKLKGVDIFGVHIGKGDRTAAPYHLDKQSDILGLLHSVVGILESGLEESKRDGGR